MDIALGIVAHRSREEMVVELATQVVPDYISWDDGTRGCTGNHIYTLNNLRVRHYPVDWYVILEDDAVPILDFREQLPLVLGEAPTAIVSLYLGTSNPTHWQDAIARSIQVADAWIVGQHLIHGVAYCLRADIASEVRSSLNANIVHPLDEQISAWARRNHVLVGYTHPSIVDHRDGASVIGQHADGAPREEPRRAWKVGRREHWHSKAVLLG